MVISILIGVTLFVNGFLAGWFKEEMKDSEDVIIGTIILCLVGAPVWLFFLILKLWKWIKSL